jgi:hypothetical protein
MTGRRAPKYTLQQPETVRGLKRAVKRVYRRKIPKHKAIPTLRGWVMVRDYFDALIRKYSIDMGIKYPSPNYRFFNTIYQWIETVKKFPRDKKVDVFNYWFVSKKASPKTDREFNTIEVSRIDIGDKAIVGDKVINLKTFKQKYDYITKNAQHIIETIYGVEIVEEIGFSGWSRRYDKRHKYPQLHQRGHRA